MEENAHYFRGAGLDCWNRRRRALRTAPPGRHRNQHGRFAARNPRGEPHEKLCGCFGEPGSWLPANTVVGGEPGPAERGARPGPKIRPYAPVAGCSLAKPGPPFG